MSAFEFMGRSHPREFATATKTISTTAKTINPQRFVVMKCIVT
jgi:hypothetical protein